MSLLFLGLGAAAYLPGISGPYLFDDFGNLLNNDSVKIDRLDADTLRQASYSLQSGPLQRPVSMLTFALNHYFAGGFQDSTPYKLTNLIIHLGNGLLVLWFLTLLLARGYGAHENQLTSKFVGTSFSGVLASAAAVLWVAHPIQITSVLYVVQRMTSLSAMFTLLALICYLKGRNRMVGSQPHGGFLMVAGVAIFGTLAILSKEIGVLIPAFVLVIELTMYRNETPWRSLAQLPKRTRHAGLAVLGIVVIGLGMAAIQYVLPGYNNVEYSLLDRLLTQPRVLCFYLSLLFIPRLDAFGLHHDDIAISTSAITPWTTLPALFFLAALIAVALWARKRHPIFSLGILWFFAGHLLESTIFPLQIAHEHRNYLPSLGIILSTVYAINHLACHLNNRKLLLLVPAMGLMFAVTTAVRANQWSNYQSLNIYEAKHHPASANAQMGLGVMFLEIGQYAEGEQAFALASAAAPKEASHRILRELATAKQKPGSDRSADRSTLLVLSQFPTTPTTERTMLNLADCLESACPEMRISMEHWLRAILARNPSPNDPSFFYYLLGKTLVAQGRYPEAIEAFEHAARADSSYLHPLFSLANVYLRLGQADKAGQMLTRLIEKNKKSLHQRNREIAQLTTTIDALKPKKDWTQPQ